MHSGRDSEQDEVLLFHPMENELKLKAEHNNAVTQPSVGKEEEDMHDSVIMMLLGATIAMLTTLEAHPEEKKKLGLEDCKRKGYIQKEPGRKYKSERRRCFPGC